MATKIIVALGVRVTSKEWKVVGAAFGSTSKEDRFSTCVEAKAK